MPDWPDEASQSSGAAFSKVAPAALISDGLNRRRQRDWGIRLGNSTGTAYQARSERLDSTWQSAGRGVIYLSSYTHQGRLVQAVDGGEFSFAIVLSWEGDGFAFVMEDAPPGHVLAYHRRIAVLLATEAQRYAWLTKGEVPEDKARCPPPSFCPTTAAVCD